MALEHSLILPPLEKGQQLLYIDQVLRDFVKLHYQHDLTTRIWFQMIKNEAVLDYKTFFKTKFTVDEMTIRTSKLKLCIFEREYKIKRQQYCVFFYTYMFLTYPRYVDLKQLSDVELEKCLESEKSLFTSTVPVEMSVEEFEEFSHFFDFPYRKGADSDAKAIQSVFTPVEANRMMMQKLLTDMNGTCTLDKDDFSYLHKFMDQEHIVAANEMAQSLNDEMLEINGEELISCYPYRSTPYVYANYEPIKCDRPTISTGPGEFEAKLLRFWANKTKVSKYGFQYKKDEIRLRFDGLPPAEKLEWTEKFLTPTRMKKVGMAFPLCLITEPKDGTVVTNVVNEDSSTSDSNMDTCN